MDLIEQAVLALNEQTEKYEYGCFMLSLPPSAKDQLSGLLDEKVKIIERETYPHVTILYGVLERPNLNDDIRRFGRRLENVWVVANRIDIFRQPHKNQDVVVVLAMNNLGPINTALINTIGTASIRPSEYPFNPHITLAYVEPGTADHLMGLPVDGVWKVDQAIFAAPVTNDQVKVPLGFDQ